MSYNTLKNSYSFSKIVPDHIEILVISISKIHAFSPDTQERYQTEKHSWLRRYRLPDGIRSQLIECGSDSGSGSYSGSGSCRDIQVFNYPCTESFEPGIYQKTLLALRDRLQYSNTSFFVRTNMSTYVLPNRLLKHLRQNAPVDPLVPYYSGVYCHPSYWIGGFGIILNRIAAQRLVEEGMKPKWFNQEGVGDDVQIGRVMQQQCVVCDPNSPQLFYTWDYTKDTTFNLERIRENKEVVFIRLRQENEWKKDRYIEAINMLNKFNE